MNLQHMNTSRDDSTTEFKTTQPFITIIMQFKDYFLTQLAERPYMPFAEFMHHALYAPFVGYYSANRTQLGPQGDFMTAPEITPLFGFTIARQCASIWHEFSKPALFEFGAGSGKLCVDIMQQLQLLNKLPEAYFILEVSAALKEQQFAYISTHIPKLIERVHWLNAWPEEPFEGIILANEVLDAMPVHRFFKTEHGLFESMISFNSEQMQFEETFKPCENEQLTAHIHQSIQHDITPYLSEANLHINNWIAECYHMLNKGLMLIIDYGFPQREYYHPDRNQGTLMCHTHHRTHTNPLANPGFEDITAHVDFTHVAEAAHQAGFHVAGFTNQASFLLSNQLLDFLQEPYNNKQQHAIKQLTHPSEMGELFKVIGLTKSISEPLQGFQFFDKRASL